MPSSSNSQQILVVEVSYIVFSSFAYEGKQADKIAHFV